MLFFNEATAIAMFPLFFGAIQILRRRNNGKEITNNLSELLLDYLPAQMKLIFHVYFFLVLAVCVYFVGVVYLQVFPVIGIRSGIAFGLIPSVFYMFSGFTYWSVINE